MARKNKRSQVRKPQRGGAGGGRATRPGGVPPVAPAQAGPGGTVDGDTRQQPAGSPLPAQRPLPRSARGRQAGPLPIQDAAIPLERVPYFKSDLRRIGLTALLMIALLIAGSFVLRGVLQA
jgi:hypothetical protein